MLSRFYLCYNSYMRKVLILLALFGTFQFAAAQYGDDGGVDLGDIIFKGPTVAITSPADGGSVTTSSVTVRGQALANSREPKNVSRVEVTIRSAAGATPKKRNAVLSPAVCGINPPCTWEVAAPLRPGKNTIIATGFDTAGVASQLPAVIAVNYASSAADSFASDPFGPPLPLGDIAPPQVDGGLGPPPPPPSGPVGGFEQMMQKVGQIEVGAADAIILTAIAGLVVALTYLAYTRTGSFRRSEVEHLAEESRKEAPDFKDPA